MSYRLTIWGAPRTKKNTPEIVLLPSKDGRGQACPRCKGKLLTIPQPSAAWRAWVKEAKVSYTGPGFVSGSLVRARLGGPDLVTLLHPVGGAAARMAPLTVPLNMEAIFYRDANRGDLFGYHQGLGDFLQEWGIVENDVLIRQTDGSRLDKDASRPRVEVVLTPLAVPVEEPGRSP